MLGHTILPMSLGCMAGHTILPVSLKCMPGHTILPTSSKCLPVNAGSHHHANIPKVCPEYNILPTPRKCLQEKHQLANIPELWARAPEVLAKAHQHANTPANILEVRTGAHHLVYAPEVLARAHQRANSSANILEVRAGAHHLVHTGIWLGTKGSFSCCPRLQELEKVPPRAAILLVFLKPIYDNFWHGCHRPATNKSPNSSYNAWRQVVQSKSSMDYQGYGAQGYWIHFYECWTCSLLITKHANL